MCQPYGAGAGLWARTGFRYQRDLSVVRIMTGVEARRFVLPYVLMIVFAALPPGVLELISVFGSHRAPPGRCEGLGGGCVLSPANTARLLLLFVLPVMVLWAAIALVALTLLRRRESYRNRPAIVQAAVPVLPALVLMVVAALIWTR
jgi:hypothetical protein